MEGRRSVLLRDQKELVAFFATVTVIIITIIIVLSVFLLLMLINL